MKQVGNGEAQTNRPEPTAVRENPQDVIARIRAARAGGPVLSMTTIARATRSGRR